MNSDMLNMGGAMCFRKLIQKGSLDIGGDETVSDLNVFTLWKFEQLQ